MFVLKLSGIQKIFVLFQDSIENGDLLAVESQQYETKAEYAPTGKSPFLLTVF